MRMKNFIFKSSNDSDLQKFSLTLRLIQAEARHQRDDLSDIKRRLTRIITILTESSPVIRQDELPVEEEEYPEEELGTNKDNNEGN